MAKGVLYIKLTKYLGIVQSGQHIIKSWELVMLPLESFIQSLRVNTDP